jgi:hypothetical protein
MPVAEQLTSQDPDTILQVFLVAPLLTLPHCCQTFLQDEININSTKMSHNQFLECYHEIVSTIDLGFGPKTILSPLGWVKTIQDLTSHILHGIQVVRLSFPEGPSNPKDRPNFKPEEWEAI